MSVPFRITKSAGEKEGEGFPRNDSSNPMKGKSKKKGFFSLSLSLFLPPSSSRRDKKGRGKNEGKASFPFIFGGWSLERAEEGMKEEGEKCNYSSIRVQKSRREK